MPLAFPDPIVVAHALSNSCAVIVAVTAFIAAHYWWRSAKIKTPEKFIISVIQPTGPLPNLIGGKYLGQGHSPALQELGEAMREQSRLSAVAANWAGASAIFQIGQILLGMIG